MDSRFKPPRRVLSICPVPTPLAGFDPAEWPRRPEIRRSPTFLAQTAHSGRAKVTKAGQTQPLGLSRKTAMTPLYFQVAQIANDHYIREFNERWSPVPLTQKKRFAGVAPRLQVRRIRAVLNKTYNAVLDARQMPAHHGRRPGAMTARYCERTFRIRRHGGNFPIHSKSATDRPIVH